MVKETAALLVSRHGPEILEKCTKTHSKLIYEVLGLPLPD